MSNKGLTLTIIFEAESANYGESLGNVSSLKKVTRKDGEQHTYISRQALRYNLMEQLGEELAVVNSAGSDKTVVQFAKDAKIDKYPELDFFGYLKTEKIHQEKSVLQKLGYQMQFPQKLLKLS